MRDDIDGLHIGHLSIQEASRRPPQGAREPERDWAMPYLEPGWFSASSDEHPYSDPLGVKGADGHRVLRGPIVSRRIRLGHEKPLAIRSGLLCRKEGPRVERRNARPGARERVMAGR